MWPWVIGYFVIGFVALCMGAYFDAVRLRDDLSEGFLLLIGWPFFVLFVGVMGMVFLLTRLAEGIAFFAHAVVDEVSRHMKKENR